MHSIKDKPVVVNGQIVIRPIMVVALTYDHRLLDGREAVTFLGMSLSALFFRKRAESASQFVSVIISKILEKCYLRNNVVLVHQYTGYLLCIDLISKSIFTAYEWCERYSSTDHGMLDRNIRFQWVVDLGNYSLTCLQDY